MAINVGLRSNGARKRSMALTLSAGALMEAREHWGPIEAMRLRWTLTSVMPGRYRLVFFPCQLGNVPVVQCPPSGNGTEYLTFKWSAREELEAVPDMPGIRDARVEYASWEGGNLIVEVRRAAQPSPARPLVPAKRPARRNSRENYFSGSHNRPRKSKSSLKKERPMGQKLIAEYRLSKTTSGAACYAVASGETGLGVLYIRKEVFGKEAPPKGFQVELTPIN